MHSDRVEVQMFYAFLDLVEEGVPKDLAYWGVYGRYPWTDSQN